MRMLVSVRDVAEAREALRAGVDFIDLKEPSAGALGGLALPVIRAVVAALRAGDAEQDAGRAHAPMISATIGDLPPAALERILERARAVGACGVDLVKVGVPGRGTAACAVLEALAALPLAIVPVLARLGPDFAGFRSAVCDGRREGRLDPARLMTLRAALGKVAERTAAEGAGAGGAADADAAAELTTFAIASGAPQASVTPAAEVLAV